MMRSLFGSATYSIVGLPESVPETVTVVIPAPMLPSRYTGSSAGISASKETKVIRRRSAGITDKASPLIETPAPAVALMAR